jgi:hypothetical protein
MSAELSITSGVPRAICCVHSFVGPMISRRHGAHVDWRRRLHTVLLAIAAILWPAARALGWLAIAVGRSSWPLRPGFNPGTAAAALHRARGPCAANPSATICRFHPLFLGVDGWGEFDYHDWRFLE